MISGSITLAPAAGICGVRPSLATPDAPIDFSSRLVKVRTVDVHSANLSLARSATKSSQAEGERKRERGGRLMLGSSISKAKSTDPGYPRREDPGLIRRYFSKRRHVSSLSSPPPASFPSPPACVRRTRREFRIPVRGTRSRVDILPREFCRFCIIRRVDDVKRTN